MKSREITEFLDMATWPGSPYGLKVADVFELAETCRERATDPDREAALSRCAMEAAGAAYAAGFEAGQRKAKNDRRRARKNRRKSEREARA